MKKRGPHGIYVLEQNHAVPFSRGILAGSISEVGFDIFYAYRMAEKILDRLKKEGRHRIDSRNLRQMVYREIEHVDPKAAQRYLLWREEEERKKRGETVILIGGSSGVGTTTIAYEVAARLNIKNVVSTDIIREIMRMMISNELNPELHQSTFNAYEETPLPVPDEYDPVIYGFERQASLVTVGVEAVVRRALKEGHSLIVEGVHLVPGFINQKILKRNMSFGYVLVIHDVKEHRKRFSLRSTESDLKRSADYYLSYFDEIRKTQNYVEQRAREYDFRVIENRDVDFTIDTIMDDIFQAFSREEKEKSV
jgi:2-phosphoglycerate kinase